MAEYAQMWVQLYRDPKRYHRLKDPGAEETMCGSPLSYGWRYSNGRQQPCTSCALVLERFVGREEAAA